MNNLLGILAYFCGDPPPYDAHFDLNSDGVINLMDLLLLLANFA